MPASGTRAHISGCSFVAYSFRECCATDLLLTHTFGYFWGGRGENVWPSRPLFFFPPSPVLLPFVCTAPVCILFANACLSEGGFVLFLSKKDTKNPLINVDQTRSPTFFLIGGELVLICDTHGARFSDSQFLLDVGKLHGFLHKPWCTICCCRTFGFFFSILFFDGSKFQGSFRSFLFSFCFAFSGNEKNQVMPMIHSGIAGLSCVKCRTEQHETKNREAS